MKFCLRNRQIGEYLQKADEIKMEYRDYKSIPDLFEKYPDKPIIVQIPYHITADWNELELYKRMKPDNLICCISSMEDAEICKDLGIKFTGIAGTSIGALNGALILQNDFQKMEELYRMIEEKIYASGYEGKVSGEEIYDEICDEIEDKEEGSYIFMSKKEDDTIYEYKIDVMEDQFNLSYLDIKVDGKTYHIDFDN